MKSNYSPNIIKEFSESTIKYILSEIPPYVGLVVFQTDSDGEILQWFGPWEKYFTEIPVKGKNIEDYAPFLFGMIPPLINPMVISHLRINNTTYAEVHIFLDENDKNWIFLLDQTREVEIIHPIFQLYNEDKLKSIQDRKESSAKGTLSALYLLDYMSFEKDGEHFRLLGSRPQWFEELNLKLHYDGKKILLWETFPYIEVFQLEAHELWNSNQDGKLISGIWEEKKDAFEVIYLQALALRHENRNYLLIKPLNKQSDLNQEFIQKARDQRLTLDQLASTEKKLKQLLSFKDQFVSIISHDLRSPIGAVIGLANLLLTDEKANHQLNSTQLELLTDIKNEMLRLLDYNDKLYQWSNLELGNYKISRKNVIPLDLANFVKKMQEAKMKEKQISLNIHIEQDFWLFADETLLGQALNNLVGNSVKFTPQGGKISIKFESEDDQKRIVISDSGLGMDEDTCNKLFIGFMRKTTMGTFGEKGTGLGLGIVKKILDAHSYSIHVQSQPGKGSTFTIGINEYP
ncbi:MAG: HAMP domain-containing sensor histidine kinase [Bacteroidales bacterium]|nr:HAMP domain-containing sensor histidine kinase [Bacteroidales bacterium]